jgi:putative two-component system response regulator
MGIEQYFRGLDHSELEPPGNILVVDDSIQVRRLLVRVLTAAGHGVQEAAGGRTALEMISIAAPDLVISDVRMDDVDGLELCRRIKANPMTRFVPVVLITAAGERAARMAGLNSGADDFLAKPIDLVELTARVRSLVRIKRATDELDSAESVIISLAFAVEARDPYTAGHSQRIAAYAVLLGERLGFPRRELLALRRGGYVHDIGKIATPDDILLKRGPLIAQEFTRLKQHTVIGEWLCGSMRSLELVRPIVRSHHERLDGSGYPDGLIGDEIPRLAHVVAVVDEYDAVTSERPYRQARTHEEGLRELEADVERGRLAADVVQAFASFSPRRLREAVETIQRLAY